MLAVDYDPSKLVFPVFCSPKIDGLRCYKAKGKALTRSGKEQPNKYVRRMIKELPDGIDGELTVGDFRTSSSALRSYDGEPDFIYWVFDLVTALNIPFKERYSTLKSIYLPEWVSVVPQVIIYNQEQLNTFEQECLAKGFEGVILRAIDSPYKCGRSTLKEGYLLKVKQFSDAEAVILDCYEQEQNTNEQFTNELGTTSRSYKQEGKVLKNILGGFVVKDIKTKLVFKIGVGQGWTDEFRKEAWYHPWNYVGKVIVYQCFKQGGYDMPRHPSMKGFREVWDM
jgi:DNA ligase-1